MASEKQEYGVAVQLFQAGRHDEAESLCRKIVSNSERFAPAFYLLGVIGAAKQQYEAAAKSLRRATELDTRRPEYSTALSSVYCFQQQYGAALEVLSEAAKIHASNVELLGQLGQMCLLRGQVQEAIEALQRALVVSPANLDILARLALARLLCGEFEHAAQVSERAYRAQPSAGNAATFATALAGLDKLEAARQIIGQSLRDGATSKSLQILEKDINTFIALKRHFAQPSSVYRSSDEQVLARYADRIREVIPAECSSELIVVLFHVTQTQTHAAISVDEGEVTDYDELLQSAAASGRQVGRNTKVVLITNPESTFRNDGGADYVIRLPVRREWIMYERMRAQRAFAASGRMTADTLFIDSDIVLNRSFDSIFAQEFDIGLTWRGEMPWAPINGGMILARKSSAERAVKFLDGCLMFYEKMVPLKCIRERYEYDIREFQGDQFAIAAYLDWKTPPREASTRIINGVAVQIFPCSELNDTFIPFRDPRVLATKYALHFKGARKKHLREYLESVGKAAKVGAIESLESRQKT